MSENKDLVESIFHMNKKFKTLEELRQYIEKAKRDG
ncbi:unnamed protein product, partial [marine sediment metagenome]